MKKQLTLPLTDAARLAKSAQAWKRRFAARFIEKHSLLRSGEWMAPLEGDLCPTCGRP